MLPVVGQGEAGYHVLEAPFWEDWLRPEPEWKEAHVRSLEDPFERGVLLGVEYDVFIRDSKAIFGAVEVRDVSSFLSLPPRTALLAGGNVFLRGTTEQREAVSGRIRRWEERFGRRHDPPRSYLVSLSVYAVSAGASQEPFAIHREGQFWYRQVVPTAEGAESKSTIRLGEGSATFSSAISARLKSLGKQGSVDASINIALDDTRLDDPAGVKFNYAGELLDGVPVPLRLEEGGHVVALLESIPFPWKTSEHLTQELRRRERVWRARGGALEFLERPLKQRLEIQTVPEVVYQGLPLMNVAVRLEREHGIEIDLRRLNDQERAVPITLRLTEVPLRSLLYELAELARVNVRIDGEVVRLVPRSDPSDEVQVYQVGSGFAELPKELNLVKFRQALGPGRLCDATETLKRYGVEFPAGSWAILNDSEGLLFVRNTETDLAAVRSCMDAMHPPWTWGRDRIWMGLTDGTRLIHGVGHGQLSKTSFQKRVGQTDESLEAGVTLGILGDGANAEVQVDLDARTRTASGLMQIDLEWRLNCPYDASGRLPVFANGTTDLQLHLRGEHEPDLLDTHFEKPELSPELDGDVLGRQIAEELSRETSGPKIDTGSSLRHYFLPASAMASLALAESGSSGPLAQAAWLESALPTLQAPSVRWYDVHTVLQAVGHTVTSAVWDKRSGGLVLSAPALELPALDHLWPPFHEPRELAVTVDAMLFSSQQSISGGGIVDLTSATIASLCQNGAVVPLGAVKIRTKSGIGAQGEIVQQAGVESFRLDVLPFIEKDRYDIDLDYRMTALIDAGIALNQNGRSRVRGDRPLVLELGGAGTAESPLFVLLLWARVE